MKKDIEVRPNDRRKLQNQEISKNRSKKDTKRWCKGKFGKEHKIVTKKFNDIKNVTYFPDKWTVKICEVCNKQLDHHFPWGEFMESLKGKHE